MSTDANSQTVLFLKSDKPSVAQIKRAILKIPVLFVHVQAMVRQQRNQDQVWPPDWALFDGAKFYHSCDFESFMTKLHDKMEEVEKRSGKKPFVITTRRT